MNTTTQAETLNVNVKKFILGQSAAKCLSHVNHGMIKVQRLSRKGVHSSEWKSGANIKTIKERFFEKVNVTDTCHEWTSHIQENGYGQFSLNGKAQYAHRVAYELHNGKVEGNLFVLHRCDNRKCVNPAHLFLGTFNDNMKDMVVKKRQAHGMNNGHAKLTDENVQEIRNMSGTQSEIAKVFGVTRPLISMILNRKIWKYV